MTLEELVGRKPKGTEVSREKLETPEYVKYDKQKVKPMLDKMLEGYDRAIVALGNAFVRG